MFPTSFRVRADSLTLTPEEPQLNPSTREKPRDSPSMQNETRVPCIYSRAIPHSLWQLKRRLDFFNATQRFPEIPVAIQEEAQGFTATTRDVGRVLL